MKYVQQQHQHYDREREKKDCYCCTVLSKDGGVLHSINRSSVCSYDSVRSRNSDTGKRTVLTVGWMDGWMDGWDTTNTPKW